MRYTRLAVAQKVVKTIEKDPFASFSSQPEQVQETTAVFSFGGTPDKVLNAPQVKAVEVEIPPLLKKDKPKRAAAAAPEPEKPAENIVETASDPFAAFGGKAVPMTVAPITFDTNFGGASAPASAVASSSPSSAPGTPGGRFGPITPSFGAKGLHTTKLGKGVALPAATPSPHKKFVFGDAPDSGGLSPAASQLKGQLKGKFSFGR